MTHLLNSLQNLNVGINRELVYTSDKKDHWQTPLESTRRGKGDCEDFAILKMAEALSAGFSKEDVRLVYCYHTPYRSNTQQAHMVLEVRVDDVFYVLDNLLPTLYTWAEREDLKPLLSFNRDTLWIKNNPTDIDPKTRLSQWGKVINRSDYQESYLG